MLHALTLITVFFLLLCSLTMTSEVIPPNEPANNDNHDNHDSEGDEGIMLFGENTLGFKFRDCVSSFSLINMIPIELEVGIKFYFIPIVIYFILYRVNLIYL